MIQIVNEMIQSFSKALVQVFVCFIEQRFFIKFKKKLFYMTIIKQLWFINRSCNFKFKLSTWKKLLWKRLNKCISQVYKITSKILDLKWLVFVSRLEKIIPGEVNQLRFNYPVNWYLKHCFSIVSNEMIFKFQFTLCEQLLIVKIQTNRK